MVVFLLLAGSQAITLNNQSKERMRLGEKLGMRMYSTEESSHQDDDIENTLTPDNEDNSLISTTSRLNLESMDFDNNFAEELSKHVSLEGPKTEYATEKESLKKNTDKMTRHWIERIDDMDPNLS